MRPIGVTLAGALLAALVLTTPLRAQTPPPPPPPQPTGPAPTPPAPVEAFFRNAQLQKAELSPSGRLLAVIYNPGKVRNSLAVFDLATPGKITLAARFPDADVNHFEWVNDERLVFDVIELDRGGADQSFGPGLFSVRPDGSELRRLVHVKRRVVTEASAIPDRTLAPNHRLLHVPAGPGDEVIVGEHQRDVRGNLQAVVVKRLNVVTGRASSLSQGMPRHATGWLFDAAGEPRTAVERRDGRVRIHWRGPGQDTWALLADFDHQAVGYLPRYIGADGELFVTESNGPAGTAVLKRFDFASGKPGAEPVVSTPGFDFLGGPVAETCGARVLGMRVETDAETTVWFDARMKAVQARIDERLPGHINRLSCRRCGQEDMVVLVRSWSDRDPGLLWIWHADSSTAQPVGQVRPEIEPRRMATLDLHRIRARDGRDLPVWVTTPAGAKPPQPRAAVVLVHGGPWLRGGHWRWNDNAQFLASRGYVVIEPEFRGSRGYGVEHLRAGFRQWGRTMQDDVADAVLWAAKSGAIDPRRVCIAGASYGGYATLMGLARHAELYRCGVAWLGVSDPRLLFDTSSWRSDMSDEAARYTLPVMIGDPVADAERLAEVTPLEQAARIKAPLVLAYGRLDRRVPLEHGEKMRAALRAAGHEPEWVVYEGEGHGWQLEDTRFDFARRMERFLAQHLRD
ncbi:MAG: prolyl oligopeptidase family serine peptidase [Rubrivivax sp.]|nr:prolyl oligopeptidase family serine peptidase [Rubrivivax sp.]